MDWTDLAQDREEWWVLVNTVRNLRVPQNVENGGFSRRAQLH
jgi:hypothetical protein